MSLKIAEVVAVRRKLLAVSERSCNRNVAVFRAAPWRERNCHHPG
jgi:hypothetical protein